MTAKRREFEGARSPLFFYGMLSFVNLTKWLTLLNEMRADAKTMKMAGVKIPEDWAFEYDVFLPIVEAAYSYVLHCHLSAAEYADPNGGRA